MIFRTVFGRVFHFEMALAAFVFVAVVAAMTYGIVRYRARPGRHPSQDTEHKKVEGLYAAGLLLVAIGIVVFTSRQNAREVAQDSDPAAMQVVVTGFQWCWAFHYVNTPVTVTGDCLNGRYPTLVLPTRERVRINVTSQDVIHSFWIPHFRYKMDAFPNHRNTFEISFDRTGAWLGHCAEFCGRDHSTMLFHLRVVSRAQFDSWLNQQKQTSATPVAVPS